MREVIIKELANGFLVEVIDKERQRQLSQMQYFGAINWEYCFNSINGVHTFIDSIFPKSESKDEVL